MVFYVPRKRRRTIQNLTWNFWHWRKGGIFRSGLTARVAYPHDGSYHRPALDGQLFRPLASHSIKDTWGKERVLCSAPRNPITANYFWRSPSYFWKSPTGVADPPLPLLVTLYDDYLFGELINPLPPSDAVQKQKKYFRGSCQFIIVNSKISPFWKPEISLFRHCSFAHLLH